MWFAFFAGFAVSFILIVVVIFTIPMRERKENELQRRKDNEFRASTIEMHIALMEYWKQSQNMMKEKNDILFNIQEAILERWK